MSTTSSTRPVLTFAVISFNQEAFVREAVEAAFAQTYSPLEIVLSDACSEDGSYEIMRRLAEAYQGPHRLILNRMPSRKAIGGHLNRVMELSTGELVFCAAADDVSLPARSQVTFDAWEHSGRQATSIHTDYVQIDSSGKEIPQIMERESGARKSRFQEQPVTPLAFAQTLQPVVFGCTHAYSRSLYRVFGNLLDEVTHEDDALAFRSVLAGKLLYINEPLVKYRVHGNNVYLGTRERTSSLPGLKREEARLGQRYRNREIMYDAFLTDLNTAKAKGLLTKEDWEQVSAQTKRMRQRAGLMRQFLEGGILSRWKLMIRLKRESLKTTEIKLLYPRLLPRPLFLGLRLARNYALARSQNPTNP